MPEEDISFIFFGSAEIPLVLASSTIEVILWIEFCRDKRGSGLKLFVIELLSTVSLSDVITVSSKAPRNFVKSKSEDWSSWYVPSTNIFDCIKENIHL